MTESYFQQVYERINSMNLADPTARLLRRLILANAYSIGLDKIGRILVPQSLRQFIEFDGQAMVAGQGDYFEVWKPEDWNVQMEQIHNTEANNQRFSTLDISSHNDG
jgi:MraZ protein